MKLLDRYLIRQFLTTFVLVVAGVPFLFLITDLTDQLDTYLGRGVGLKAVAISYVYYLPQLIFWAFPIAALIATVFTVGNMTRHQEIAAAKAGGVSFYRLTAPLFVMAALLSVAAVGVGELVPVANQRRSEILDANRRFSSTYRMNFVFRTENGRTLSASRYSATSQEMDNVVLEGRNEQAGITVHQTASAATFTQDEGWVFHDGYLRWIPDEGDQSTFYFLSLAVPELTEGPEELMASASRTAEEMRYGELARYVGMVERSGGDTNEFRVHLAQKISLPLAILVIVLFGAPLATSSRRGGTAFGVGVSLIVTMTYLMLFKVGEAIGISGTIPAMVAAWAPNVIFLLGAGYLLSRVRT